MNREQAQEILRLYRPGIDDDDADLKSALEFAQRDPEMTRWLQSHSARHHEIRESFRQIAVPAGLKEQILAERKPELSRTNIIHMSRERRWWANPIVLSTAAAFAVLFAVAWFWIQKSEKDDFARYRTRMVSTALRTYGMDLETNNLQEIRSYLSRETAPSLNALPDRFQQLEPTGCVVLRWENHPVSMICFKTGRPLRPGETSDVFLFIVEKSIFTKSAPNKSPRLEQVNRLVTASWTEGNQTFLLATSEDQAFLRSLL